MQGNLAAPPYSLVTWQVYGQPDNTGAQWGGQPLQADSIRVNQVIYNNQTQNPLTLTVGGDLSGSLPNPSVSGLQGNPIATTTPASGQGLLWSGSAWTPTTILPQGTVGGDLSGSLPNPTVVKLQGHSISSSAPSTGNLLEWNGTNWTPLALGSGLSLSGSTWSVGQNADNNILVNSNNIQLSNNLNFGSGLNVTGGVAFNSSVTFETGTSFVGSPTFNNIVQMNTSEILWTAGGGAPTLTQSTATSDVAASAIIIQPQAPYSGATGTHKNGPFVVFNVPAPISGGQRGGVGFWDGGIIGQPYFAIQSDGSGNTQFSGSGAVTMSAASTVTLQGNAIVTGTTTFDSTIGFAVGATATLSQTTPVSDQPTHALTIQSQAPYASASVNTSPGNIVLNTPAPVGGGSRGNIIFEDNGTNYLEFFSNGSGSGRISLSGTATITAGTSILFGNSGLSLGFYGASPVARPSQITNLTDNSAGTPGSTLAAIGGTTYSSDAPTLRNWIASVNAKISAIENVLSATAGGLGLTA